MSPLLGELIGTTMLLLLGNGVVANLLLQKTKAHNGTVLIIHTAWGIAVFVAVFISAASSGAHLNPAVTMGLAVAEQFPWSEVPGYILAQFVGAMLGTTLVWLMYKPHYDCTEDPELIRATFCTSPAIRHSWSNFLSEVLGTFVLVYGVFHISGAEVGGQAASLGALDALPVALVVFGIGMSLGGTTGYAINPARDLGPRLMHAILPIRHRGSSDWTYSWLPVVAPLTGAVLAAGVFQMVG